MSLTRRRMLAAGAASLAAPRLAFGAAATRTVGGRAFASGWRIVLPAGADGPAVRAEAAARLAAIDRSMSPYRVASDLSRINRARAGEAVRADPALCLVARMALNVSAETDGSFDPTVGPLVARFGFGPIAGRAGGAGGFEVGEDVVVKAAGDATLDLCGIAKGFALDRLVALLAAHDLVGLVEVGGEVRCRGSHPDGRAWQVAVERPAARGFAAQRIVAPGGLALATSGHAANGYDDGARQLSHVMDPLAGRPADPSLASVTVAAATGIRADALATALLAMGPRRGPAFARGAGIDALFLVRTPSGLAAETTGAFAALVTA